jgi:hypothetical protein
VTPVFLNPTSLVIRIGGKRSKPDAILPPVKTQHKNRVLEKEENKESS